ncbi:MAG: homoaconitate hydratase [Desulfurococcales archaeon]|nr:homoaconitate hydratase [Desulfurococcales archaeon]
MAGVELDFNDKIVIAQALDDLGVDIIEAGFPASSELDKKVTRLISREVSRARIAGLARANAFDVDEAAASEVHVIHVFIATSDIHIKYKLSSTREKVIEAAVDAVERARSYGVDVLFSAEDATRSDPSYLVKVYKSVVDTGVDYINIPDTVGVMTPWSMENLVRRIIQAMPRNRDIRVDVHCHNDFGMATANSIAGIMGGADGVQVTVNGFGERGGNAALEEVVASIHFQLGYSTNINLQMLTPVSRLVADRFKIKMPPNKAITGLNAFAHEAGIHVHGVLNNPLTYEPILPESVGNRRRIVLGRHSGKAAVEYTLKQLGVEPSRGLVKHVLRKLKEVAPKVKKVDEDMIISWIREYDVELGVHVQDA